MNKFLQGVGLQFLNSRTVRTNVIAWATNLVAGSLALSGVIDVGTVEILVTTAFNIGAAMLSNYFRVNPQAKFGTR